MFLPHQGWRIEGNGQFHLPTTGSLQECEVCG